MSSLVLVAITHDNAPFDLLERVALDAERSSALAADLVATPGVTEAVVLSTCNRTELYLAGDVPDPVAARAALAAHTGVPVGTLASAAMTAAGDAASLHLFRVACGLESRVVGEGEILGQVRRAASRASVDGTGGSQLANLFRFAAAAGRRTRRVGGTDTTPSLAAIALDSAGAAPAGGTTLVLGAGRLASALVAELSARHLDYLIAARRPQRALALARRVDHVVDLDRLADVLAHVDVVACATSARRPLLYAHDVVDAMTRRSGRPLTILDLSMPRNVDPAAGGVPGVRVIDLESMTADPGQLHRHRAAQAVASEHERYRRWLAGRAAAPAIVRLRGQVLARCTAAARTSLAGKGLDQETVERVAARIAAQLLHGPTVALKDLVARGDYEAARALLADYGIDIRTEDLLLTVAPDHWAEAS